MTLDDVLNEFVAENDRPTAQSLEEWAGRYPQYRRELVDFAAAWAEQLVLPAAPELGPEAEKALIDRTMSHVLNVAYEHNEQEQGESQSDDPIDSLTGQAQRAGMDALEFAKSCGLDLALISKLNSRQIEPRTIPARLIRHIARLLGKAVSAVTAYLALPPQALAGRAFLARGKPAGAGRQNFADAVRSSSLSEAEKARWLNEGADEEEG
ncbi:MAG: hypothetical protein H6907_10060 [Hyphomicrobiales bacterium]|nr:hypothetical protein [Hyphomicrobiales bacterium]MCP5372062.1 hypothetical protein [Hyphomicrobiales bacterium]